MTSVSWLSKIIRYAVKLGLSVDSSAEDVIDAYLKTQRAARVEDEIITLTDFRIEKK